MKLHISLRKIASQRELLTFDDVSRESLVSELKLNIAHTVAIDPQTIQLVYACRPLSDESQLKILEEDGEDEKLVYVMLKPQSQKAEPRKPSPVEQQQLILLFRTALTNPGFRQVLQNISKPESIKSLTENIPGLSGDQVAMAMLYDWELLLQLAEAKTVNTLAEKHPAVLDAVSQVLASIPNISSPTALGNSRRLQQPGRLARSLGADADVESMEEDLEGSQQATQGAASSITPAQLAAALSLAQSSIRHPTPSGQNTGVPASLSQVPPRPNPVPSASNNRGLTPELFSQALLQAMTQMAQPAAQRSTVPSNPSSIGQEEVQLREQFSRHLPQMRELGIADDSLSLRALQATNGDVEAALNLIYAGLVDE